MDFSFKGETYLLRYLTAMTLGKVKYHTVPV